MTETKIDAAARRAAAAGYAAGYATAAAAGYATAAAAAGYAASVLTRRKAADKIAARDRALAYSATYNASQDATK